MLLLIILIFIFLNLNFVIFGSFLLTVFEYQWLDTVKINKHTPFDPNVQRGSRVMSICTYLPRQGQTDAQQSLAHQKGCNMCIYTCQWYDNADMHTYANI